MNDHINIADVEWVNLSVSPAQYQPTVAITGVEFAPGDKAGVRLFFDRSAVNARWPDVLVWPNPTNPQDGHVQWTLFAGLKIAGRWIMGSMFEFWSDRHGPAKLWTGAAPWEHRNWNVNWAYSQLRWGNLATAEVAIGTPVAFMMAAGAIRGGSSSHPTFPERSGIVVVPLQERGIVLIETGAPTDPPIPPPPPLPPTPNPPVPPAPPVPPGSTLDEYMRAVLAELQLTNALLRRIFRQD